MLPRSSSRIWMTQFQRPYFQVRMKSGGTFKFIPGIQLSIRKSIRHVLLNYSPDKEANKPDTHPSESRSTSDSPDNTRQRPGQQQHHQHHQQKPAKSVSQTDNELRERLEQMSGEGGASGIEYEDGQPNTMKRSVRNNMFRYI